MERAVVPRCRLGVVGDAAVRDFRSEFEIVTGAGAPGMAEPLRRTYDGMPDPKIVIAVGTDAISGGMLRTGGVGDVVPIDVWLPGSPPPPFAILHALLLGIGRL
jgi:Ni,Fe-hydrogenase III small subunit